MGSTPARPAADEDDPGASSSGSDSAAFPDLSEYVDLVSELEEILRGAAEEPSAGPTAHSPEPSANAFVPDRDATIEGPPPVAAAAPLHTRARATPPELVAAAPTPYEAVDDAPAPEESGFWQVDDQAWSQSPAWNEPRRRRGVDLFIIGALVVLIAGGGAYSAIRLGDGGAATLADNGLGDASRAEAGFGVPFAAVDRTALLRADPTLPVPSLDAAVAGAEVTPLPVIIQPPVEATNPVFTAEAAPPETGTVPAPNPAPLTAPLAVGGPLVPFDPAEIAAGVPATTTTTVTTWVNMRAGPDNGEAVVMVVAPATEVTVRACDYWCSVTVNGRNGYIFEDFLVAHP